MFVWFGGVFFCILIYFIIEVELIYHVVLISNFAFIKFYLPLVLETSKYTFSQL